MFGVSNSGRKDVYFALASFKEPATARPDGKTRPRRVRDNVALKKCLYLDVDAKEGDKGYPTKSDALANIKRVVIDECGLPPFSLIVDSGNGFHCYWTFNEAIPLDRWQPYATALQALLVKAGLRFDSGVTVDAARILRAPGSQNFKDPADPKDVHVVKADGPDYGWDDFGKLLPEPEHTLDLSGAAAAGYADRADIDMGDLGDLGGGGGSASMEYHMEHIVPSCPLLRDMAAKGGSDCEEPLWKDMLLVAARCTDGEQYAHLLSQSHPGYSHAETQAKFERQKETLATRSIGPTTCATFHSKRPSICSACPHWSNPAVKSPVVLGTPPSDLPPGYRQTAKGIERLAYDADADEYEWKLCLPGTPKNGFIHEDEEHRKYFVFDHDLYGQNHQRTIPVRVLRETPMRMIVRLADHGLVVRDEHSKDLRAFFVDWITKLQTAHAKQTSLATKFGWNKDGFQYGTTLYTKDGAQGSPLFQPQAFEAFREEGKRTAWDAAVQHMMSSPFELQLIPLVSFAAPLTYLSNLRGFLFSFRSAESGTGKSTALRMGASLWGDPHLSTFKPNDTPASILRKLGQRPHLPAYWDEVRSYTGNQSDMRELLRFIFQVAEGVERGRLRRDISHQSQGHWQTLVAVCTNETLKNVALGAQSGAEPVLARMMEITVPPGVSFTGAGARAVNALSNNYGHVGGEYLEYLVPRREKISKLLPQLTEQIQGQKASYGAHRYWCEAAALMVMAAKLGNSSGLYPIDPNAVLRYFLRELDIYASDASELSSFAMDGAAAFSRWLMDNINQWLLTDGVPLVSSASGRQTFPRATILSAPEQSTPIIHIDNSTGIGMVRSNDYKDYCDRAGRSYLADLMTPKLRSMRGSIGRGTQWSTPQARVIQFSVKDLGLEEAVEKRAQNGSLAGMGRI